MEFWQPSFVLCSFCSFQSKLTVSLVKYSWEFCVYPLNSMEFTPIDKRLAHGYFLDNPSSIFSFCWHDRGHPWVTHLISSNTLLCDRILWPFDLPEIFAKDGSAAALAFLDYIFMTANLLPLMSFATGLEKKFPKLSSPGSLFICLFNNYFLI